MHARMRDKSCAHVILDVQVYSNLFGHVGSTCGELCWTKKRQYQRQMCHLHPLQCRHGIVVGQVRPAKPRTALDTTLSIQFSTAPKQCFSNHIATPRATQFIAP